MNQGKYTKYCILKQPLKYFVLMHPGNIAVKIPYFLPQFILLLSCSSNAPMNVEAEKGKIQAVIETSIGWALTKDKQALYNAVAQDSSFFIINPDSSTVDGFAAFEDLVENFFMLDDFGEFRGRSTSWINARWTGVLEKRKDQWKIVQMHFSFPK